MNLARFNSQKPIYSSTNMKLLSVLIVALAVLLAAAASVPDAAADTKNSISIDSTVRPMHGCVIYRRQYYCCSSGKYLVNLMHEYPPKAKCCGYYGDANACKYLWK